MALRLSTGLRNAMLSTNDFSTEMNLSKIDIYSGTQPSSADNAVPAGSTLLVTISESGGATGLTFDAASNGSIEKASAETWSGTAVASGTAGWFRMYESGGSPASSSSTESRLDGSVAVSGGDINISSTSVSSGATQTVSSFTLTLPAS